MKQIFSKLSSLFFYILGMYIGLQFLFGRDIVFISLEKFSFIFGISVILQFMLFFIEKYKK